MEYGYPEHVTAFNEWYLNKARPWGKTTWLGVRLQKNPCDLWMYQTLITEIRPQCVIELGTFMGGTSLWIAHLMDLLQIEGGIVITVDKERHSVPNHNRIHYLHGNDVSAEIASQIRVLSLGLKPRMVIADSEHTPQHIAKQLAEYQDLVTVGSYFIVEDTSRDVWNKADSGLHATVKNFAKGSNGRFAVDTSCERFGLTFNPGGYLKCLKVH